MSTRPTGTESPAEQARRALREARRADAAQRDGEESAAGAETGSTPATTAPVPDVPPPNPAEAATAPPGTRPGDVAREALRAARRGGAAGAEAAEGTDDARAASGTMPPARTAGAPGPTSDTRPATTRGGQSAEAVEELKRLARAGRRSIPDPSPPSPADAPPVAGADAAPESRDAARHAPRSVDAGLRVADASAAVSDVTGAAAVPEFRDAARHVPRSTDSHPKLPHTPSVVSPVTGATAASEPPDAPHTPRSADAHREAPRTPGDIPGTPDAAETRAAAEPEDLRPNSGTPGSEGSGPGTPGPETPSLGGPTPAPVPPETAATAGAAARSALVRAGAERRRAGRGAGKPVRSPRRRKGTGSGPHGSEATDPRGPQPRAAGPRAAGASREPQFTEDLRRTFPAVATPSARTRAPARASAPGADKSGAPEGSWWGAAWVRALEQSALDPVRLARGRAYTERGKVGAVTVTPGLVLAYVHGSRPRPYRAKISLPTFTDEEWDRFLDTAAAQPGHIAALLDRQLPRSLADCGVPLLPVPGELRAACSCPDSGDPCKHAAALCYRTARLLDEDPFVLLLLRGRGERGLLAELSRRNATLAARSGPSATAARLPGVRARDALAARTRPPLPRPQPPLPHPGQPPTYPAAPGGPDPFALDQLATDAAARAHALLATGRDPVAELTLWQDAVRIAAGRPGSGLTAASRALYESLAAAAGRTATDLARAVAAWRQGGKVGLAVLEEPWDPPAGRFDQARPALRAAEFPLFTPWRNQLTHPEGTLQLRLGRGGLWYAYESEPGRDDWWPRGTPDHDPVGALTALTAGDP